MYECLTRGDDTDRHPTFGNNFWAEFFLLRPKISVLETEIGKVGAEALAGGREPRPAAPGPPPHPLVSIYHVLGGRPHKIVDL